MKNLKKCFFVALFLSFFILVSTSYGDDASDAKDSISSYIDSLTQKYDAKIKKLEADVANYTALVQKYQNDINNLNTSIANYNNLIQVYQTRLQKYDKGDFSPTVYTGTTSTNTLKNTTNSVTSSTTSNATSTDTYDKIMEKVNNLKDDIFKESDIDKSAMIGYLEYVDGASAFFIDIDDGKNPIGITTFKYKMLYSYDKDLNLKKIGVFWYDSVSSKYITTFGSNPYPYGKNTRTKKKNPSYKGKLIEEENTIKTTTTTTTVKTSTYTGSTSTNTGTTTKETKKVTLIDLNNAYKNKNYTEAISLSDEYIKDNSNDKGAYIIRYMSYYYLARYSDSLNEIQKIEKISSPLDNTTACNAVAIAKYAKNTDLETRYSGICKK